MDFWYETWTYASFVVFDNFYGRLDILKNGSYFLFLIYWVNEKEQLWALVRPPYVHVLLEGLQPPEIPQNSDGTDAPATGTSLEDLSQWRHSASYKIIILYSSK